MKKNKELNVWTTEMNTRKIGRKLENYFLGCIQELDSKARLTKNSGANLKKGDLDFSVGNYSFRVECKKRNTKDITVKKKVFDKLKSEIPTHVNKIPLYVLENVTEDKYVVLELKDFIFLLK